MTPPGRQLRSGGVLRGATSQSEALPADLRIRSTSAPWRDADTNLLYDPVLPSLCALMRSESHRARKPEGHRTRVPDTRGSHKFNMVQFLCGYKRLEARKANLRWDEWFWHCRRPRSVAGLFFVLADIVEPSMGDGNRIAFVQYNEIL